MTEITREQFFEFIKKKDGKNDDIKSSTQHYLNYFNKYTITGNIIYWNWSAALCTYAWLVYRKMFLWAAIYFCSGIFFWSAIPFLFLFIDSNLVRNIVLVCLLLCFYLIPGFLADWAYLSSCRRKIFARLKKQSDNLEPRAPTSGLVAGAVILLLTLPCYPYIFQPFLVAVAAANGNFYSLAKVYIAQKDYESAFLYMQTAANKGNTHAQYDLGIMYMRGDGVEKDYKKAFGWFYSASVHGQARASYILYDIFAYGRGVPKDEKKAKKFLILSAKQGDMQGQYYVGILYLRGNPSPRKIEKAVKYLRLSEKQRYRRAQYHLGLMYSVGVGVEKDDKKAIALLKEARAQEYSPAHQALRCIESKTCNREALYRESLAIEQT